MLPKMETALDLGYKALWVYDQEQRFGTFTRFQVSKEVAKAKLLSTTWGFDAINDALQWQGAFGYSKDCPEEWALRGIRSFQLAEGSREIMKQIVARETIGKDFI
jgi:Acyl-CoA dehydrogenases